MRYQFKGLQRDDMKTTEYEMRFHALAHLALMILPVDAEQVRSFEKGLITLIRVAFAHLVSSGASLQQHVTLVSERRSPWANAMSESTATTTKNGELPRKIDELCEQEKGGYPKPQRDRFQRVEFPRFYGDDIKGWLYKEEQYFDIWLCQRKRSSWGNQSRGIGIENDKFGGKSTITKSR
ncbi:hypothetical protein HAX54_020551, partial [Datura stramonium]|nr:hypothetical protein [Datura stramonium]